MVGGELREREEAERREVGERLVERPREVGGVDGLLRIGELELVVLAAEQIGDAARVGELVRGPRLAEADREGLDRPRGVPRHQRDDQARVQPAREHRAERHVAHQPQPHRLLEQLEQVGRVGVVGAHERVGVRVGIAPVRLARDPGGAGEQELPRLQLPHRGERGQRRGHEAEGEIGVDRGVVEVGRDETARQQALQLGGEEQQAADARVVERLDPEAVAGRAAAAAPARPRRRPRTCRAAGSAARGRSARTGAAAPPCRRPSGRRGPRAGGAGRRGCRARRSGSRRPARPRSSPAAGLPQDRRSRAGARRGRSRARGTCPPRRGRGASAQRSCARARRRPAAREEPLPAAPHHRSRTRQGT